MAVVRGVAGLCSLELLEGYKVCPLCVKTKSAWLLSANSLPPPPPTLHNSPGNNRLAWLKRAWCELSSLRGSCVKISCTILRGALELGVVRVVWGGVGWWGELKLLGSETGKLSRVVHWGNQSSPDLGNYDQTVLKIPLPLQYHNMNKEIGQGGGDTYWAL